MTLLYLVSATGGDSGPFAFFFICIPPCIALFRSMASRAPWKSTAWSTSTYTPRAPMPHMYMIA